MDEAAQPQSRRVTDILARGRPDDPIECELYGIIADVILEDVYLLPFDDEEWDAPASMRGIDERVGFDHGEDGVYVHHRMPELITYKYGHIVKHVRAVNVSRISFAELDVFRARICPSSEPLLSLPRADVWRDS